MNFQFMSNTFVGFVCILSCIIICIHGYYIRLLPPFYCDYDINGKYSTAITNGDICTPYGYNSSCNDGTDKS